MNFLIYIGGGFYFTLFAFGIMNMFFPVDKHLENIGFYFRIMTLLSVVMVWIWICLKFIK